MRIITLAGSVVFAAVAFAATGAMAQSDWSGVTCSDFTKMDAAGQASIASQIKTTDVAQSMTSNSGTTGSTTAPSDVATGAASTVQPGALVAACQSQPTLTLHDLISQPDAVQLPAGSTTK